MKHLTNTMLERIVVLKQYSQNKPMSQVVSVASRFCRKSLGKLLTLSILLLLSVNPAHAQMGNYWSVTPCDAIGKPVANLTSDGNGYYGMTSGIETESVSNTYPVAMVAAAVSNPGTYGDYLQSAFPLGISPSLQTFSLPIYAPNPITVLGGNFGEGNAVAYNCVSRGSGAYTYLVPSSQGPPLMGPINGSLTKDLTGQLRFYWRVQWMGMGAPTIPMPDHLNLCVKANLTATASVSYNSSVQRSGLSAQATASDQVGGNGFSDAVSASAGDTGTIPSSSVTKYHLVSASVLPLAGSTVTGIAQVYLNGSTHTFVNNAVPYLVPGASPVLNGQTQAYASVTVVGGVKQDSRTVSISADVDNTYSKVLTGGLDANGDGYVGKVKHTPAPDGSMSGDIGIPYGEQHTEQVSDGLSGTTSKLVVNDTQMNVKYTGHIPGNWATWMSHYWWGSTLKNYSIDGSLWHINGLGLPTEGEIPVLTNVYLGPIVDSDNGTIIAKESGKSDTILFKFQNGDNRPSYSTGNDGDGAIGATNYSMKIHVPFESFPSHKAQEIVYRIATAFPVSGINPVTGESDIPMTIDTPFFATYGDGTNGLPVTVHLNNPSVLWDLSADVMSLLSTVPNAVLDAIFAGANIGINRTKPVATNYTVGFSEGAWNDPWSTGKGPGLKANYHMFPRIRVRYNRTYTLVDSYDRTGFRTESMNHSDKFVDNFSTFGYFQPIF